MWTARASKWEKSPIGFVSTASAQRQESRDGRVSGHSLTPSAVQMVEHLQVDVSLTHNLVQVRVIGSHLTFLLSRLYTRHGLRMRGIPVSAWMASFALLLPPLTVVCWITGGDSTEPPVVPPPALTDRVIPTRVVSDIEDTPPSVTPSSFPDVVRDGLGGQERKLSPEVGTVNAKPVDESPPVEVREEDNAAHRVAVRRDELRLAGRLERFDENRERYDERSTHFEGERRVATSPREEQNLAQLFVAHEVSDLLAAVDCRETLCRLSVESGEDSVATILRMRGVLIHLGKDRALRGERTEGSPGTRYVIYVRLGGDPYSG